MQALGARRSRPPSCRIRVTKPTSERWRISLQLFKQELIAKKAADEAAAIDAEAKIERDRRVDSITRDFESMIGDIVETVSSASTELEASAGTLTATAELTQLG